MQSASNDPGNSSPWASVMRVLEWIEQSSSGFLNPSLPRRTREKEQVLGFRSSMGSSTRTTALSRCKVNREKDPNSFSASRCSAKEPGANVEEKRNLLRGGKKQFWS